MMSLLRTKTTLSLLVLACVSTSTITNASPNDRAISFARLLITKVWEFGLNDEIEHLLGCEDEDRHDASLIHNDKTWEFFRDTYERVVSEESFSLTDPEASSGFQVPIDVAHNSKGRAVLAVEPIQAGTLVWKSAKTARFHTGEDFRYFLHALPTHLACDVLMWAYTRLDAEGEALACVDLDPGSLMNGCDEDYECNLVAGKGINRFSGCKLELVASRDIPAGEELMLDYAFSEGAHGWAALGLSDYDGRGRGKSVQAYFDRSTRWHKRQEQSQKEEEADGAITTD
eukprot:Nitzschia sp. Nitz4//scaffold98_size77359//67469//68326//NITZ4_005559-RA/size77359-processed-gene-0.24-mRNA-1//1//CDS//3329560790//4031//frame0